MEDKANPTPVKRKMPLEEAYSKTIWILVAGVILGFLNLAMAFAAMLYPGRDSPGFLLCVMAYTCLLVWVVLAVGVKYGVGRKADEFNGNT